ncbi:hypothetical protein HDU97_003567 [Phlyctochytrium planicorne]|nr:hypothetical protein HDU97_003567 [Phlyctochytrium planicorne]
MRNRECDRNHNRNDSLSSQGSSVRGRTRRPVRRQGPSGQTQIEEIPTMESIEAIDAGPKHTRELSSASRRAGREIARDEVESIGSNTDHDSHHGDSTSDTSNADQHQHSRTHTGDRDNLPSKDQNSSQSSIILPPQRPRDSDEQSQSSVDRPPLLTRPGRNLGPQNPHLRSAASTMSLQASREHLPERRLRKTASSDQMRQRPPLGKPPIMPSSRRSPPRSQSTSSSDLTASEREALRQSMSSIASDHSRREFSSPLRRKRSTSVDQRFNGSSREDFSTGRSSRLSLNTDDRSRGLSRDMENRSRTRSLGSDVRGKRNVSPRSRVRLHVDTKNLNSSSSGSTDTLPPLPPTPSPRTRPGSAVIRASSPRGTDNQSRRGSQKGRGSKSGGDDANDEEERKRKDKTIVLRDSDILPTSTRRRTHSQTPSGIWSQTETNNTDATNPFENPPASVASVPSDENPQRQEDEEDRKRSLIAINAPLRGTVIPLSGTLPGSNSMGSGFNLSSSTTLNLEREERMMDPIAKAAEINLDILEPGEPDLLFVEEAGKFRQKRKIMADMEDLESNMESNFDQRLLALMNNVNTNAYHILNTIYGLHAGLCLMSLTIFPILQYVPFDSRDGVALFAFYSPVAVPVSRLFSVTATGASVASVDWAAGFGETSPKQEGEVALASFLSTIMMTYVDDRMFESQAGLFGGEYGQGDWMYNLSALSNETMTEIQTDLDRWQILNACRGSTGIVGWGLYCLARRLMARNARRASSVHPSSSSPHGKHARRHSKTPHHHHHANRTVTISDGNHGTAIYSSDGSPSSPQRGRRRSTISNHHNYDPDATDTDLPDNTHRGKSPLHSPRPATPTHLTRDDTSHRSDYPNMVRLVTTNMLDGPMDARHVRTRRSTRDDIESRAPSSRGGESRPSSKTASRVPSRVHSPAPSSVRVHSPAPTDDGSVSTRR